MQCKYVTFGFDDGVTQDARLIKILDKYGLKASFFLNSALLGIEGRLRIDGKDVGHTKVLPSAVKELYKGHEVAVHTLTHPNLPDLPTETIAYQAEWDRGCLSRLSGTSVTGMAYPFGGVDERVEETVRGKTGIRYVRTTESTHAFDLPKNPYRWNPTAYIVEGDEVFFLARKFIELQTDVPQIFYVWGHSYELDVLSQMSWERFEELCRLLGGRSDMEYGTNGEVLRKTGCI